MSRRVRAFAAVMCLSSVIALHGSASAAASVSNGKLSCTVTAAAPTLSKTSLTAKATIKCTAATTASVNIAVSEMDGTVEQSIQAPKLVTVAVAKANTNYAISGATITCVNTETGNEEFATKAQVVLTTSTGAQVMSAWDIKVPANDAFVC